MCTGYIYVICSWFTLFLGTFRLENTQKNVIKILWPCFYRVKGHKNRLTCWILSLFSCSFRSCLIFRGSHSSYERATLVRGLKSVVPSSFFSIYMLCAKLLLWSEKGNFIKELQRACHFSNFNFFFGIEHILRCSLFQTRILKCVK